MLVQVVSNLHLSDVLHDYSDLNHRCSFLRAKPTMLFQTCLARAPRSPAPEQQQIQSMSRPAFRWPLLLRSLVRRSTSNIQFFRLSSTCSLVSCMLLRRKISRRHSPTSLRWNISLKAYLVVIWLSLQAFEQYDSVEDPMAIKALKYMLLSKVKVGPGILFWCGQQR